MRFAIDVVFLDAENRVVKIAADLKPWKAAAARKAKSVVELPAGEVARRGLRVGERLELGESSPSGRRRRMPWMRVGTNMLLGAVWLSFAISNLADWHSARRPVGLGMMAMELMIAVLFFVRREAWVTSRAPLAWTATAIGTWGMLAARPHFEPLFGLEIFWFGLQLVGAVMAACSLGVLGRSFGLVAANRGVQTRGPYGIVRHPLYVSYFVTDVGYALENPSVWNAGLLAFVLCWQLIRIRTEEDCLRADPQYLSYCERVRYRLLPLVW